MIHMIVISILGSMELILAGFTLRSTMLVKRTILYTKYVRNTRFKNSLVQHKQEFFLSVPLATAWMTKEASWNHV